MTIIPSNLIDMPASVDMSERSRKLNNVSTKYMRKKIAGTLLILTLIFAIFGCGGGGGGGSSNASSESDGGSTGYASGSMYVSWNAPSTNADGTPLYDLAGYRVYYSTSISGLSSAAPINVRNATTYTIDNLPPDTYYCAVTAFDYSGNESAFSNIVEKNVY